MDVLLASMRYHPVYAGPALRFRRYAPGMAERNIKMRVFTGTLEEASTLKSASMEQRTLPLEVVEGLPVQRVRLPKESPFLQERMYFQALVDYCQRSENRPELIQLLSSSLWALPQLIRLRRIGIPMVFSHTMLGQMSARTLKRAVQQMYWRVRFQVMDCVVVSSTVMADALRRLGVTTRIEVIPNGVDLDRFRPLSSSLERSALRIRLGLVPDTDVIVFIGPLVERKGLDVLVEAWRTVARARPHAYLVLVGPTRAETLRGGAETTFHAKIKTALAESGAADRVLFTGAVDSVEAYFQAADLFVFPSRREGMPNVVPEAMACGLPVIMTPFLGLPEEFGVPGVQYVQTSWDPQTMAEEIIALLDDRARRRFLGRQARAWVEQHLDVHRSLDRYASLYCAMLAHHPQK